MCNGNDLTAIQFWGRMRRVGPYEQHFAYFYTECCKNAGEFEEAIKILWLSLDYFLRVIDYPERTEFCPETIVNSLDISIDFDHDLPEIIRIWEATLDKHPPKYSPDARQKCLATALLEHSNHLPPHEAHGLLRKATEISPDREETICQLRANFQITGISYLEDNFWISRLNSTDS
jgi:hypothetical protein